MEQLTETISLDMEEANELAFKIKVEGASSPAKVRLVCESNEVSYMFNGRGTNEEGVVQFTIPQMKEKLSEGTYSARVEVLIENRYFSPVQFQINFKKPVKVFAESVQFAPAVSKPEIKVTAAPIVVVQQKQEPKPLVVEKVAVEQPKQVEAPQNKEKFASLREKFQGKPVTQKATIDENIVKALARQFVNSTKER